MTMRQWYASCAMVGLHANPSSLGLIATKTQRGDSLFDSIAEAAFEQADAMLAQEESQVMGFWDSEHAMLMEALATDMECSLGPFCDHCGSFMDGAIDGPSYCTKACAEACGAEWLPDSEFSARAVAEARSNHEIQ